MPDQTYVALPTPPRTTSPNNLNTTEPDQVTGVPTQATEVKPREILTELGGTGTTIVSGFLANQDYNPEFTGTKRIELFNEMRTDATVRAGLSAVKLPLLSADWYIKEPSGDDELGEVADFVDRQLMKNPSFSWTSFLRQALTMCEYGNAIFEKVFEQLPDGKIGWKRLAPRMSKTIYRWTLQDGKSPGIYQILPTGKTAEIPRWKLLYFINEQEGSNYEGISLLRAPHKNWFYKNLYYKIDSIAAEKQGMGIPQVKRPPNATPQDIAKAREIAQNIRTNEKAFIDLPAGFEVQFLDTHADKLKDCKEMIEHHDRQIVKAFLAQFLELGTKSGGSYALSADQSKLFLLGLEYLAKIVQEEMNKAIKELCDLNFPNLKEEDYPTLEYGAIGQIDFDQLSQSLQRLTQSNLITPNLEIEKHLLASMSLPVSDDLAEQREEKQATAMAAPANQSTKEDDVSPNTPRKPTAKKNDKVQADEVMDNILTFREDAQDLLIQIEQAIAEKRTHAEY